MRIYDLFNICPFCLFTVRRPNASHVVVSGALFWAHGLLLSSSFLIGTAHGKHGLYHVLLAVFLVSSLELSHFSYFLLKVLLVSVSFNSPWIPLIKSRSVSNRILLIFSYFQYKLLDEKLP